MEKKDVISFLEDVMELEEGTLAEETVLANLVEWDSVARLSLLASVEDKMGKNITPSELKAFKTVKDACNYFATN